MSDITTLTVRDQQVDVLTAHLANLPSDNRLTVPSICTGFPDTVHTLGTDPGDEVAQHFGRLPGRIRSFLNNAAHDGWSVHACLLPHDEINVTLTTDAATVHALLGSEWSDPVTGATDRGIAQVHVQWLWDDDAGSWRWSEQVEVTRLQLFDRWPTAGGLWIDGPVWRLGPITSVNPSGRRGGAPRPITLKAAEALIARISPHGVAHALEQHAEVAQQEQAAEQAAEAARAESIDALTTVAVRYAEVSDF
jgi:hypothetical protein